MSIASLALVLLACSGPTTPAPPTTPTPVDTGDTDVPATPTPLQLPPNGRWLRDIADGVYTFDQQLTSLVAAPAGDLNGDGLADVRIDARFLESKSDSPGGVRVVLGPAAGETNSVADAGPFEPETRIGLITVHGGDLDGDGLSDLLIASRPGGSLGPPAPDTSWGHVFRGPVSGSLQLEQADQTFPSGGWLQPTGGSDGFRKDGAPNVVVTDFDDDTNVDMLVHGSEHVVLLLGPFDDAVGHTDVAARFTSAVSGPRLAAVPTDLNGDGVPDLILRAPPDESSTARPSIYFLDGTLRGEQQVQSAAYAWVVAPEGLSASWRAVARVLGDVDGDGHVDLALGIASEAGWNGAAHILLGPFTGERSVDSPQATFRGGATGVDGNTTSSVTVLETGDFEADGTPDLWVVAHVGDVFPPSRSRALLFAGATLQGEITEDDAAVALYGGPDDSIDGAANVGDLNGDGIDDLALWSTLSSTVFFVYGRQTW